MASRRITVNAAAYKTLTGWAARWPHRRFAVEGAAGLGRGIAQLLAAAGEHVIDVPATLAARARLLDTGGTRKTDRADAASIAHAAMRHRRLRQVVAEDHHTRLRLLSERRDDLARERVRLLNRLHVLLRDLIPGGAATDLTAAKAATLLRSIRPLTATDSCRRELAREMLADLRHLDRRLHTNQAQTRQVLAETHSTITEIRGVGYIIAGKSSATSVTSPASPPPTTSPATPAPRHWKHPAANADATGSTPPATGNSTPPYTPSRSSKPATPARAASTTNANSTKARPPPKPDAHSNDASPTSSTDTSSKIN